MLLVCALVFKPGQNVGGSLRIAATPEIPQVVSNIKQRCIAAHGGAKPRRFSQKPGRASTVSLECFRSLMAAPVHPDRSVTCLAKPAWRALVEKELATVTRSILGRLRPARGQPRRRYAPTVSQGRELAPESLIRPQPNHLTGPVTSPHRLREPTTSSQCAHRLWHDWPAVGTGAAGPFNWPRCAPACRCY